MSTLDGQTAPVERSASSILEGRTLLGVTGTLRPVGGAERAFRTITSGLAREAGLSVRYCVQIPSDPETDGEAVVLRPGHEPPSPRMITRLRRCILDLPEGGVVFAFQIHANILAATANALLPRRSRRPVVLNDRSNIRVKTSAPERAGARRRLRAWLLRRATRFAYRRATHIVCNSEENATLVGAFLGPRRPPISTIYNPLDAEGIASRFPPRDRSRLVDPAVPRVVAHGRLVEGKGWPSLIRAFARVHAESPAARLRIVGDGPLMQSLRDLATDMGVGGSVELPGHRDDPLPELASGDLYVLASEAEGLPNCLLEAIALGLPCISTDCPTGPAEILGRNGEHGVLVPVGDEARMASAIRDLLSESDRRAELARAAGRRAEHFGEARAIAAYVQLLEQIVGPG